MKTIDLNGQWDLRWCDGQRGAMPHYLHRKEEPAYADIQNLSKEIPDDFDVLKWISAEVPGEVHLDLMRAGIIQSPYTQANVLNCRWVEECFWFYRRVFDAAESAHSKYACLSFEGLDYAAVVYLNGREIARHENAFYPCDIDVSGLLKETDNVLLVRLESGLFSVSEKPIRDYYTATMTTDVLLHKRNWLRKTQSQTGWDWSPRMMNVGIYKPVSIKYSDTVIVESVSASCTVSNTLESGTAAVRMFTACGDRSCRYTLALKIGGQVQTAVFDTLPEKGVLSAEITVENPELWWPLGYGDPFMYKLEITLSANGIVLYTETKQLGFRHVRVNTEPHPVEGSYFIFEINHQPVFMRGANLVPNDLITAAATPDRYRKLVALAAEANFNFLRVWGGGLYESDDFYDACNSSGIMVWQEFIAACAVVPIEDEKLLLSIQKEAVYNIRRLSVHPSLIAWCGNNEIGWGEEYRGTFHFGEDDRLYHEIFPTLLAAEDPEKYYQPTSPFSEKDDDYNAETSGDQHPWSVGFANKDSRDYEKFTCRFPNEGGILGPVSLKTVEACLRQGEGIHSFSWQVHDNMLENNFPGTSPDCDVSFWLGREVREMSIEEYVYAGGFVQAEGLKRYIDNFRRRKYSSSSAVFWMYNDCWPVTRSWTIVDYYLNKTPSFHPVRRAFSPVAPVVAYEKGRYVIYGVNDTLEVFKGRLQFGVFSADGEYLRNEKIAVVLPENSSAEFAVHSEMVGDSEFVFACLYNEADTLVARTRYSSQRYSDLTLPDSVIRVTRADDGYLLSSDSFVMGVCIGLDGDEPVEDNLFDLYPGQTYLVRTKMESLRILYDLNSFMGARQRIVYESESCEKQQVV